MINHNLTVVLHRLEQLWRWYQKKKMKALYRSALIVISLLSSSLLFAQNDISKAVETRQYVFIAERANPSIGGNRILSPGYDLTINKDTVISYLPFFGRAYSAPIDPSEAGIKFKTSSFDYKITNRKKGGWDVTIRPTDVRAASALSLTIFANGYATLQVRGNNRSVMTFQGRVTPLPNKNSQ